MFSVGRGRHFIGAEGEQNYCHEALAKTESLVASNEN